MSSRTGRRHSTSVGYVDLISGPFKDINNGTEPYVHQLVRTANSILDERRAVGDRDIHRMFRPTIDVNLFAPSIYPHFLKMPMPPGLDLGRPGANASSRCVKPLGVRKAMLFKLRILGSSKRLSGSTRRQHREMV